MISARRTLLACLAVTLVARPVTALAVLQKLRLVIHVHTTVSTGSLTPEQVMQQASTERLDGVLFTDSLLRRWEYGLWPVRGWVKKVAEQPSVMQFGAGRYLTTIRHLADVGNSPLAISGVEAAPFYYWRRSPFDRMGGEIRGWNRHLLVFGIDEARRVEQLPLETEDPYHGDRGAQPYQRFIDAATAAGGLVFWAHPANPHEGRHGAIADFTEAYPHLLEETVGYQGFAITYLGYLSIVEPGGLWDRLLLAYCQGRRARPVWVIAESDWRGPQERPLAMSVTELLVEERSPAGVLQALREGRMWAAIRQKSPATQLAYLTVTDLSNGRIATVGDHLTVHGTISVQVGGTRAAESGATTKLTLIKDGRVFASEEVGGASIAAQWSDQRPAGVSSYRLILEDPSEVLYTNPIFVRPAT